METVQTDAALRLSGLASGWYAVAFSSELPRGGRAHRRLFDNEVVVTRARSGRLSCRVGESDWTTVERHGAILVSMGRPGWTLFDAEPPQQEEWGPPATRLWCIRTHPQEILENTVDVSHFRTVHGYEDVTVVEPLERKGPHLSMSYVVTRPRGLFGRFDPFAIRMRLDIRASGIGYSNVDVRTPYLRLRTIVMPTPKTKELTEVRVVTQSMPLQSKWVPGRWLAGRVGTIAAREMARDFEADIRIWESKRYWSTPTLVDGDGPIRPFRAWAKQFYLDQEHTHDR